MINFRYHLASLIAVFLALAVGVVMGSTVVDRAIVEGLRNQIDDVRAKAAETRTKNARLQGELDRLTKYADDSAAYAVAGRMPGEPVVVVAERGVDGETVKEQVRLLRESGASAPGVLWLENAWNLGGDGKSADALRSAVGSSARTDKTLRADAVEALADRLGQGVVPPGGSDVLDELTKAGFVTFEGVDDPGKDFVAARYPGAGARALLLGGAATTVTARDLPRDLARALVAAKALTAVGEVFRAGEEGPERGTWLGAIRDDQSLAAAISTIDDIDLTEGRVAAAVALADLGRGVTGRYGYGVGAERALPTPPKS